MLAATVLSSTLLLYSLISSLPPAITPEFSCLVRVDIRWALTHYILAGMLVVDYTEDSMFAYVYGDEPGTIWGKINTSIVVSPAHNNSDKLVNLWQVKNGVECTSSQVKASEIPAFKLPPTATYIDKEMVQDVLCDVWQVKNPMPQVYYINFFVNNSNVYQLQVGYTTAAAVYLEINVYFINHDLSKPDPTWFDKPPVCS